MVLEKEVELHQEKLFLKEEEEKEEKLLHLQSTKNNSFPKELRVLKRRDFLRIQNGKAFKHKSMVLLIDKSRKQTKFGIVVSKKVGNAVTRNYYKRIFRVFFRNNKELFNSKIDYVIVARFDIVKFSFKELEDIFLSLIKKSNEEFFNKTS